MRGALYFFVAAGVVSAFLFIFFGRLNRKVEGENKNYDILVDFPFDLSFGKSLYSVMSRIFYVLPFLAMAFLPLSYIVDRGSGLSSMAIFLMTILIFNAGAAMGILFVPSQKTKPHVFSAIAFIFFGGLCAFFAGLFFFQYRLDYPVFSWTFSMIFWALCAFFLILVLNPKLANWAKMNVVESVHGSYLEKPRPFWLAFSEWLALILQAVLFIALSTAFLIVPIL